ELLPMQQQDFEGVFEAMQGQPVTVRLLDPPLHEFLPSKEDLLVEVTKLHLLEPQSEELTEKEGVPDKVKQLDEQNPMRGVRGWRVGMMYPEIYEMQAKAIFYAAAALREKNITVEPEIMVPLVGHVTELKEMRQVVIQAAKEVEKETGQTISF